LFGSFEEAIMGLVNQKDQFWCRYCCRGLFFPQVCELHSDWQFCLRSTSAPQVRPFKRAVLLSVRRRQHE
jgi:hypothetical protein